ncbi:MAG TPA: tetraacyldisaccharide 4'-kinase [Saprospiraceae bacterium]|nr:tetraacyldisaccharide 4'-kinase [Saprospiraceae bacterium]
MKYSRSGQNTYLGSSGWVPMVNQWVFKLLLLPFALLYGMAVTLRNLAYSIGLLKGSVFNIPVISVGNLTVGGTGKTPHTEFLLRLLHEYLPLAVLSRGYKRKTTGYLEVQLSHNATIVGDEPLQFKRKYPDVSVAVAENRSLAIPFLLGAHPEVRVVILDDGFQHREVIPGLNVLLTEYNRLFTRDFFLPVGRLREWRDESSRADVIIVTKCPESLGAAEMDSISKEVTRGTHQPVFYSHYHYGNPYVMYGPPHRIELRNTLSVLLVAAIAGTEYLIEYVGSKCKEVRMLEYADHHSFTADDIMEMERHFRLLPQDQTSILLTTEKDALRLDMHRDQLQQLNLPIYVLPIAVEFLGDQPERFGQFIKEWLLNFKR